MKNQSKILKCPIMLVLYILLIVVSDELFGKATEGSFWNYVIKGVAFLLPLLISDLAEKHGWDTWSGLVSKFKATRNSTLVKPDK